MDLSDRVSYNFMVHRHLSLYPYIYIICVYIYIIFDGVHSPFSAKAEHHIAGNDISYSISLYSLKISPSIPSGTSAQALQRGWDVADQGNIVLIDRWLSMA